MNARGLHTLHGLDRTRELALDGAHACHFLHERGETDRPELVEQLVAGVRARGQSFLGEQHARLRRLLAPYHHLGAVRTHVEDDPRLVQRRADAADVLLSEAGVERIEIGAAQVIAAEAHGQEHGETDKAQRHEALGAERNQIAPKPVKLFKPKHVLPNPFRTRWE